MSELKIRNSGTWAAPTNIKVKSGGSWTQVSSLYVKQDGTWYTAWAPLPEAPVLTVTNTNAYVNATSWTEPSSILSITSYTLQRSTDNATWTTIYTGLTRSFNDTGLTGATTYYYRVLASNIYVSGPYSTTVSQATRTATFKRSTFTSSGTFSKPIGVTSVQVLAIQGGSGTPLAIRSYFTQTEDDGAGPYTVYFVNLYPTSGGGSGGFAVNTGITTPISALSYSVAVGAGGNASTYAAGGTSSFNASSLNSTVSVIADQPSGRGGGGSTEGFNESNNGPSFFYSADITSAGGPDAFNSSDGGTSGGSATWFGSTFNVFIENLTGMGGGGGGLGGAANGTSGGPGRYFQEYGLLVGTGTSVIYGAGASGGYVSENGGPLYGAAPAANTGSAGGAGYNGAAGIVFVGWFD